ncbi:MAG TPA: MarR family transcriptional regulator [Chitinophagaceae bacterium]|nr:MarR family transcriptional regulator [Chitinophagaceae bacterium]
MEQLNESFFYTLEKSIKSYRKLAQRNMLAQGFDLTIDQWLVLKALIDNPDCTQQEIAEIAFKDFASLSRIIELLVKKGYLTRTLRTGDRRRFDLAATEKAKKSLKAMQPVTENNRELALRGITKTQARQMRHYLSLIIDNCNRYL